MTLLNSADAVYLGSTPVDKLYLGETQVWPAEAFMDFTGASWVGVPGNQDQGTVVVAPEGTRLEFDKNVWKLTDSLGPYVITPNTVIDFEVRLDGFDIEIVGVGFQNTTALPGNSLFKVYGTQNYGNTTYNVATGTWGAAGTWRSFSIPIGTHYTGTFVYILFAGDDDNTLKESWAIRNVRLYEL